MKRLLRSLVGGPATIGLTGAISPVVSALSFVDEKAPDPLIHLWAVSCLKVAGVRTEAQGLGNLPQGNFVLAVNHISHFDALVLFAHIRRHMRFVAKQELAKIPVFGPALKRAGNVFVERTGSQKDKSVMAEAVVAVRDRVSIVFFAEGTRSEDGLLRPFKKGAAVMAIEAQVPVVPAAIWGTHQILKKGSLVVHPHPAALVIGSPLETAGLTLDDRDSLTTAAHAAVSSSLERAKGIVGELAASG
jgi:1-acyl-sn-glycerol-3-phosphate acyltransferase